MEHDPRITGWNASILLSGGEIDVMHATVQFLRDTIVL